MRSAAAFLPSAIAIGFAGLLILKGFDHGWGWLMLMAVILMPSTGASVTVNEP